MDANLYNWRDREPTDDEFAIMRSLSDVRAGKGVVSDNDVRMDKFLQRDAVEFAAASDAVIAVFLAKIQPELDELNALLTELAKANA